MRSKQLYQLAVSAAMKNFANECAVAFQMMLREVDGLSYEEIAYSLGYTVDKATSGNDTGLLISMTDTKSPGTSLPLDIGSSAAAWTSTTAEPRTTLRSGAR